MAKSRGEASGFSVALRMCPKRVANEESEGGAYVVEEARAAFKDGSQDCVEEVLGETGCALCGQRDAARTLGRVGDAAPERSCEEAGPDQALGDGGLAGVEFVEV